MTKKKPKPGKCVHCLKTFKDLTWDHVFPESWYPTTTIPNKYKWKVPSCQNCNKEYGAIENDFLTRIAICLDSSDSACAGIVEKGMRAINPEYARNEKDKKFRQAKRKKILSELLIGEEIPQKNLYPNFGLHPGEPVKEQVATLISRESVKRLAEKIVRGIFYLEDGKFIEPPYRVTSYGLSDRDAERVIKILEEFGSVYTREPGIVIRRAVCADDPIASLFDIQIWGRFKIYANVFDSSQKA